MSSKKKINQNEAKAVGKDLSISTKMSVEVCNFIRNKNINKAKKILNDVIDKKSALPVKRYNKDLAHKKKIGPGRYPLNVCKEVLKLLDQVEANAQFKGLSTSDLVISHIKADKAATPFHHGRQRRRKMKRTHLEIIVLEKSEKKDKEKKTELKKVVKKEKEIPKNDKKTEEKNDSNIAKDKENQKEEKKND